MNLKFKIWKQSKKVKFEVYVEDWSFKLKFIVTLLTDRSCQGLLGLFFSQTGPKNLCICESIWGSLDAYVFVYAAKIAI